VRSVKILMAFHAPPYPPDIGPSRRNYHVLAETLKRHRVTVLSLGTTEDRAALVGRFGEACADSVFVRNSRGAALNAARAGWYLATSRSDFRRLYRAPFQRELDRLAATRHFDLMYCSTTMLGCYRLPEHLPVVGDTHNVEHDALARASRESPELWRRAFYRREAWLTRREEIAYTSRCAVVCATSDRDRTLLSRLVPHVPIAVVPNGIDCERYRPEPDRSPEPGAILFTGLMRYYPNAHGIRRFVERVLPGIRRAVPHTRLWIVGADPPSSVRALAAPDVVVTGRVPDVRPFYARAQIAIVPLWIGGGTRVKVLEAMAMGVPVVSTRLGCEGLDVRDGGNVLIGDSDAGLADAAVRALMNPALRSALSLEGAALADDYDWRRIGGRLDAVFRFAHGRGRCSPIAGTSPEASRVNSTNWTVAPVPAAQSTSEQPSAF
jgi:glycosyltransferase involved in cell wall biosynthesis